MTERNNPSGDARSFLGGFKREETSIESTIPPVSKPVPESTTKVSEPADPGVRSVIGHNIQFRGELIGTEDLLIEGKIEGTVLMQGQNLTIGTKGELDANIHAQNIIINGKLNGDVLADELIEIKKTAVVKGNLISPRIQLEDGGKFRGSMDMVDTDAEQAERREAFKAKLVHPELPPRKADGTTETTTSKPTPSKETKPADNKTSNKN
jgi:cytoskeletal protein CcmA (bactofilin family)